MSRFTLSYSFEELALIPGSHGVLATGDATIDFDDAGEWTVADVSLPGDFVNPLRTLIDASLPAHRLIRDALQLRYADDIQAAVDSDLLEAGFRVEPLGEALSGREMGVGAFA